MKIKIKHLAEEARIIRLEEHRTRNWFAMMRLKSHRRVRLRRIARANQLAYAYLRGVPYTTVERTTKADTEYVGALMIPMSKVVYEFGEWRKPCFGAEKKAEVMKNIMNGLRKWMEVRP